MTTAMDATVLPVNPLPSTFERVGKSIAIGFVLLLFAANQFPHTTTIKEIAFYGALALFVSLLLFRKISLKVASPLTIPAVIFFAAVCVGSFWALNQENTLHDLYTHLIRYILLWLVMTSLLDRKRDIELLLAVVVGATTVFCLYSMVDMYIVHRLPLITRLLNAGSKEITTNLLGIHTMLAINLAVYKLKSLAKVSVKVGYAFAILVLLLASLATQSRSLLLAMVLSSLIIFLANRDAVKLLVVLAVLAVGAMYSPLGDRLTQNLATDIRIKHMFLCLEVVKEYPLTGIGFGMQTFAENLDLKKYDAAVSKKYKLKTNADIILTDPHNLYTDIAVRTGIVGFSAFMYLLYATYRMLWQSMTTRVKERFDLTLALLGSLSSFLLIGLFEPVFSHSMEMILCLLFAMTQMVWRDQGAVLWGDGGFPASAPLAACST